MAQSSISWERSDLCQICSHDKRRNQSSSLGRQPTRKETQHGISGHGDQSFHKVKLATAFIFLMFAELDWAINCQCKRSLIPLIMEGEFICHQCWQVNGYSAICLLCSLASVVLPTFHAWLIGRALEGRLWRLQGHTLRKCLPKSFNMALRWGWAAQW